MIDTKYAEILRKMNCEYAARCIEKGLYHKIDNTVISNGFQVDWLAMCTDVNMGYILCSIKRVDCEEPFSYASLMLRLYNDKNRSIGGGGGGSYYFDTTTKRLYLCNSYNDMSKLMPGRITIRADKISSMPYIRLSSSQPVSLQNTPFDMPFAKNSPFFITVTQIEFKEGSMEYTYIHGSRQIRGNGYSKVIQTGTAQTIPIPWASMPPQLYISTHDEQVDEAYRNLCSVITREQNGNESTYHCRFDIDIKTLQNIHDLYFIYTGHDPIQYEGDFGTTFTYEANNMNTRFNKIETGKPFLYKGAEFFIKEIVVGTICTRVLINSPYLTADNDISSFIRLKSGQKTLALLSVSGTNESIIFDFATEDMDDSLIVEYGEDSVPIIINSYNNMA